MKKQKHFILLAVCLLILGILAMPMNLQEASAAARSPYMSVISDYVGMPREKAGGCYVWVEESYSSNEGECPYSLKSSKSTKKKVKVLAEVKDDGVYMDSELVSNGKYVFYTITKGRKTTICRVSAKSGKPKMLKTLKGSIRLGTYFKGRLYYVKYAGSSAHLLSLNVSNKSTRVERKNFNLDSGYGPYLTGVDISTANGRDREPKMTLVYNAKTRKTVKTQTGLKSVAAGKWIYIYDYDFSNINKPTLIVKRCSPAGKQVKVIKRYKGKERASYFGRKNFYLENGNGKIVKKLNYHTGKITKAR